MSKRVDSAARLIEASPSAIFQAFSAPRAMEAWLPPHGMTGRMLAFAFFEGGAYRMRLTYNEPRHVSGKTSEDGDEVEVRFLRIVPAQRIEQAVTFSSVDPAFAGEMRITWILEPTGAGTLVTVRCEDVPAGVCQEDHEAGLASTLDNLAAFADAHR